MGSGQLSLLCCKQTGTCHRLSVAWPHIPWMLSRSHSRGIQILAIGLLPILYAHSLCPLKRHTDTHRGIAAYLTPTHCAHSRGILILAVALLPISHPHSSRPLKRHTDTCRGTAILVLSLGLLYAPLKWHLCQLRGLSLKLSLL